MFLGNNGFKVEDDVPIKDSAGYLYDATDNNQWDQDPFSFSKQDEIDEFVDQKDNKEM